MKEKKMAATPQKVCTKQEKYFFSKNKKLNSLLNDIADSLFEIADTKKESIIEVKNYKKQFPREIDFNIAQYGNLEIYYNDVRKLYKKHSYATVDKMSDSKLWETYKRQVGYVVRNCKDFK